MDDKKSDQPQNNDTLPSVSPTPDTTTVAPPSNEVEPPTLTPETPPAAVTPAPKKKNKKMLAIIIAVIIVILGGGITAGYFLWYQNPDKVVTDGVVHALQAKTTTHVSTFEVDSSGMNMKVAIDGQYKAGTQNLNAEAVLSMGSLSYTVKGSVLYDSNNDLYIKFANLDKLTAPIRASMPESALQSFDSIVSKINDKWVKVTADELAVYNEAASKSQSCISNAVQQTENHAALVKEIEDNYKKNSFITVNKALGEKDGNTGFELKTDREKLKAFVVDLKNTKSYKTLHDCDATFTIDENTFLADKSGSTTTTQLWVNTLSHQIAELSISTTDKASSSKTSLSIKPTFNKEVSITAPEQSTTLKELQPDIEALQQMMLPSQAMMQAEMDLSAEL